MTLNANEPTDQRLMSELPNYVRETRLAINALVGSGNMIATNLVVGVGATSLSVGVELSTAGLEILLTTGAGVADLETILGGTEGQIKVFIFHDTNVDLVDGNVKTGGEFYLNHLPAASDFDPGIDDILSLIHI